jgi:hypothetical protein
MKMVLSDVTSVNGAVFTLKICRFMVQKVYAPDFLCNEC